MNNNIVRRAFTKSFVLIVNKGFVSPYYIVLCTFGNENNCMKKK